MFWCITLRMKKVSAKQRSGFSKQTRKSSLKKSRPKKTRSTKISSARSADGYNQEPQDTVGFVALFLERISWLQLSALKARKSRAGRPAHTLSRPQLLVGIVFHYTVSLAGNFAEHLMMLTGISMAQSTLSERRQALPAAVFEQLLGLVLRPLKKVSAAAFYKGLRLVAIDGVAYSVGNHRSVNRRLKKQNNQKGQGGFAKLRCAVLLELLMHNPLAARIGCQGQSEWKLAQGLLEHLPMRCLLMADRLYGCGAFLVAALKILRVRKGHLLIRVKRSLKVLRTIKELTEGSQLVEIKALNPQNRHEIAETVVVREIRATIRRKGCRPVQVRLWTSLLDEKKYPAQELVRLYMSRWEQELYFRELKHELGTNDLLRSQTVETAAQEVAAMIMGSSLIAEARSQLEPGEQLSHRISFLKVWDLLEPLWLTLLLGADILTTQQKEQLAARFYETASKLKMAKKRIRSCPRVLRSPLQPWPKKTKQKELNTAVTYRIQSA